AVMPLKVFNSPWDAALRQIGGRRERAGLIRTQSARDKTRIVRRANSDGYVDTFLYEVTYRIADPQVDRHFWVAFTKQRQLRRKDMQRNGNGGRDLDSTRRLSAHGCGDLLDFFDPAQQSDCPVM